MRADVIPPTHPSPSRGEGPGRGWKKRRLGCGSTMIWLQIAVWLAVFWEGFAWGQVYKWTDRQGTCTSPITQVASHRSIGPMWRSSTSALLPRPRPRATRPQRSRQPATPPPPVHRHPTHRRRIASDEAASTGNNWPNNGRSSCSSTALSATGSSCCIATPETSRARREMPPIAAACMPRPHDWRRPLPKSRHSSKRRRACSAPPCPWKPGGWGRIPTGSSHLRQCSNKEKPCTSCENWYRLWPISLDLSRRFGAREVGER
jgi:hypothetical protein